VAALDLGPIVPLAASGHDDQRHVASAGVDQGLQVGIAPIFGDART
jgi:hypothetical protein